ncbi:MFS transporter [Corynebacterium sp. A21]|uniref:MFS transporter n=1 Tax=Corynebacterium sp. A21 TaxID=3457318 RepID=UPI003FD0DDFD
MAFSAFVYVTFEMFSVGLIRPMAHDLGVAESQIGLLMTVYAGVVAVVTLPAMWLLRGVNKRPLFLITIGFLLAGTIIQALAGSYATLAVARIIAALTHGVFWALVAPMAARMAPPGSTGKAIGMVSIGSTMALVLGSPLATWFGELTSWRIATWVLGALTVLAVAVLLPTLPSLPPVPAAERGVDKRASHWSLPSLVVFLLLTCTAVFAGYTYLGLILEETAGQSLVPLGLAALGAFGLIGVTLASRFVDSRMIRATLLTSGGLVVAAVLGVLAFAFSGATATVVVFLAVTVWGIAYGALPTVATTFFMHAGRANPDAASSLYVVTYQVGIAAGAAVGATVVDAGRVDLTLWIMGALALVGLAVLAAWSRPLMR